VGPPAPRPRRVGVHRSAGSTEFQLVFDPDGAGDAFALPAGCGLRTWSRSRPGRAARPETVNPDLPTGEVELKVTDADLLADAETPPFQIEGFSGEVGEDARLRHRYLDLRREQMRRRSLPTLKSGDRDLSGEGYEIETPMPRADAGGCALPVPSRRGAGSFYALPQPPAVQAAAVVAGFERYFQIVRCRDECESPRLACQLDLEMSVSVEDVSTSTALRRRCSRRWTGLRSTCPCGGSPMTRRCRAMAPTARTCASGSSWSS
jgi:aspartyl-tRNA synthetase